MPPHRVRLGREESGQVLVLAAVALVAFLGFVGLVVDVGRMYIVRQRLRNYCDAGAGAAAAQLPINQAKARTFAMQYYCRNAGGTPPADPILDNTEYQITVAPGVVDTVKVITPWNEDVRLAKVQAQRTVASSFLQVLGMPTQTVGTYAVGRLKGRSSQVSLLATNYSQTYGNTTTQPLAMTRSDGRRYSIVIDGNDLTLGLDDTGSQVGWVMAGQNIYIDSNNTTGQAMYGDTEFANHSDGNQKTSVTLLSPAAGATGGMVLLDPSYYLDRATQQGHVYTTSGTYQFKNKTLNGFYFVYGDVYVGKNVQGTATIAATGRITTGETGQELTFADTENKILFYAGADPALSPETYFASDDFDPLEHAIHLNDNNTSYTGTMYAPFGYILVESNQATIRGALAGDTVGITQYANNVTVIYDPTIDPPLAPGVVLLE